MGEVNDLHFSSNVVKMIRARMRRAGHAVGADKSLARPGRKQATVTEDFDVHISYLLS
jgi:hypothetical protein